ncbi:MAG TPA: cysteine desulfurase-like protein [Gemmatimonadaceae bacterium]|nr:cysteine desulfurase-like protein [Gemmatimonadaceae bacterium]
MTATAERVSVSSVDEIRADFPAQSRTHGGHVVAYLDGPGGTQVPRVVAERMNAYLLHHNANTHWRYPTSAETDAMIMDARRALADFVNGTPDEIAFGANMTTLTFHLSRALGRDWGSGDEIVVTELDHHANVAPWRRLEKERGVRVLSARMRVEDGTIDLDDLEQKIGPRTRLVAVGGASNALGTISDIRRVVEAAHVARALAFVDAVHLAPHELIDVEDIGCDLLACSAYKFYGPHIGVLWGRHSLIDALDVPKLDPAPTEAPENLETGTQNHEGMIGAGAAVDYLAGLARGAGSRREALSATFSELHRRGVTLFETLWRGLSAVRGLTLYGRPPGAGARTPTVAFTLARHSADDVAVALAEQGLFVSHGDFYAATVIERLGVGPDGVVRVGCSAYSTIEEIERVVHAVSTLSS